MTAFLGGNVVLHPGDAAEVIGTIADQSIDAVVTDPPYALASTTNARPDLNGKNNPYARQQARGGFMGKQWDTGQVAFDPAFWREVLRVLKPGGHVVAFGGTRTYHRLAVAIEDAGFEIRDQLQYLYGSGFPKSHNASEKIERCRCQPDRPASEYRLRSMRGDDVSAAQSPSGWRGAILQSSMPEQGSQGNGTKEAIATQARSEQPGVEGRGDIPQAQGQLRQRPLRQMPAGIDIDGAHGRLRHGASASDGALASASIASGRVRSSSGPSPAEQRSGESGTVAEQSQPQARGAWEDCDRCGKPIVPDGLGTALKPACEPIVLARKPLIGTVAETVLRFGTGAINVDGCRVQMPASDRDMLNATTFRNSPASVAMGTFASEGKDKPMAAHVNGRWPANIVHDGSEEVVGAFPESVSKPHAGAQLSGPGTHEGWKREAHKKDFPKWSPHDDAGSAARFFYTAKADADDRIGSKHPTVKPVDLMRWLCRLICPPGGVILDPFAGTGTTGEAAFYEGFSAVLIEREAEYQTDIARRMALVMAGPDERAREAQKARQGTAPPDYGPLFT